MIGITTSGIRPTLARLEWESEHFGLAAAQITERDLSDAALAMILGLARQQGLDLVVWAAPGGRHVPDTLLGEFGGKLIDRKATFARPLDPLDGDEPFDASNCRITPYRDRTPSAPLFELASAAGEYSRFRVDRRFALEKFEAMYRRWMERSVNREMADIVLVARLADHEDSTVAAPAGMVTLDESEGTASIGLIAVSAEARGMGVGSALMAAAHRWMLERGAGQARVVTQLANLPACRLYERAGYRLGSVQHYFHFWL